VDGRDAGEDAGLHGSARDDDGEEREAEDQEVASGIVARGGERVEAVVDVVVEPDPPREVLDGVAPPGLERISAAEALEVAVRRLFGRIEDDERLPLGVPARPDPT